MKFCFWLPWDMAWEGPVGSSKQVGEFVSK